MEELRPDPEILERPARLTSWAGLTLFLILAAESLAWSALKLPETQSFDAFAFGDSGSNYTAQYLLRQGARPTLDFDWIYGLLPLEFGRIWTDFFGTSPQGYHASLIVGHLVIVAGMARFLIAMGVTRAGILLVLVTMPHWLAASYPNWTHVIEACLLIHALAAQARGQKRLALALVTVSAFVKPSMAYVYGAWIVLWMIIDATKDRRQFIRLLLKSFTPAALTALTLGTYLSLKYSSGAVITTLWPTSAMRIYQAGHFGFFFGIGSDFWRPQGVRLGYYFGGIVAFWLAASIVLMAYATKAVVSMLRSRGLPQNHDRLILTCATLHAVFVCLFFGAATSWFYYAFILVMGVASLGTRGKRWDLIVFLLLMLAVLSLWSTINSQVKLRDTTSPHAATYGLWTTADAAEAWSHLLEECHGRNTVFLCGVGEAELLTNEFCKPVSCFLSPGMEDSPDAAAKATQIEGADLVVVPMVWETNVRHILQWPKIKTAMAPFQTMSAGKYFLIFRRAEGSR